MPASSTNLLQVRLICKSPTLGSIVHAHLRKLPLKTGRVRPTGIVRILFMRRMLQLEWGWPIWSLPMSTFQKGWFLGCELMLYSNMIPRVWSGATNSSLSHNIINIMVSYTDCRLCNRWLPEQWQELNDTLVEWEQRHSLPNKIKYKIYTNMSPYRRSQSSIIMSQYHCFHLSEVTKHQKWTILDPRINVQSFQTSFALRDTKIMHAEQIILKYTRLIFSFYLMSFQL